MKRFSTILLACVLTVTIVTVALAQEADFDVWDFATHPTVVDYDTTRAITSAIALANVKLGIPVLVMEEVDNYLPMVAVKLALLSHSPSTNSATQALLSSAIPTGDSGVKEVRYLAAFKAEIRRGYAVLNAGLIQRATQQIASWTPNAYWYWGVWRNDLGTLITRWMRANHFRALKVADIMGYCDTRNMTAVAVDYEWIRNSARVEPLSLIHI